jgi:hypothetical protein
MDDLGFRTLKSGLYDASRHKAHNLKGEFCKFCARELEMIRSIFLKEGKYI